MSIWQSAPQTERTGSPILFFPRILSELSSVVSPAVYLSYGYYNQRKNRLSTNINKMVNKLPFSVVNTAVKMVNLVYMNIKRKGFKWTNNF